MSDDFNYLPSSLREIADTIGLDETLVFVEKLGGCHFLVPRTNREGLLWDNVLCENSRYKLIKDFGGCTFYLPKMSAHLRHVRDNKIKADRNSGLSLRELTIKYGLCDRRISDIINSAEKPKSKQLSLFG